MSAKSIITRYYEVFLRFWAAKKQSQNKANIQPLAGNPKHEVRNPKRFEKTKPICMCSIKYKYLRYKILWRFEYEKAAKKQSQFYE